MKNHIALKKIVSGRNTAQKVVMRARIILLTNEGKSKTAISKILNISRPTIDLWLQRYTDQGVAGLLKDLTRPGRKPQIDAVKEKEIVDTTLHTKPNGATHWSTRTLAKEQGVSKMTVQRIWKKYNIKPHLVKHLR